MASFEEKVDKATSAAEGRVLGVVAVGFGKDGNIFVSHTSGKCDLKPDAKDISQDSILALASCTKLITTLAALRLVQDGKLSLDDTSLIEKNLPELYTLDVLTNAMNEPPHLEKRKNPITLRHLLTHSSGSSFHLIDPRLQAWRATIPSPPSLTAPLPEAVMQPFSFQPGEGWTYGGGLDWTGVLISRVTGQSLGEYMRKAIFDVVGCDDRLGFGWGVMQEKEGGIVLPATRGVDGGLVEYDWPMKDQVSERGGGGLYCSARNFGKVLADLISPSPKILNEQMLGVLFSPQFEEGSKPLAALHFAAPIFKSMTGTLTDSLPTSAINHALGGMLIIDDNQTLGKTKGTMTWGGALNCLWFVNREVGVAAFYGSSMFPPGEGVSSELMGSFIERVWSKVGGEDVA